MTTLATLAPTGEEIEEMAWRQPRRSVGRVIDVANDGGIDR